MAIVAARGSLTAQQSEAVFRREVSVVLSSGAGCGKTHVLTQRYLAHLEEDGAEVSQLVAITFTDRAARQMRQRIRKELVKNLQAAESDAEAARWSEHLRGLETAQISTIHAFCGTLLRQHAVEAGLDPRFDVLEDFLASNLEVQALTDRLQRLLTADTPAGTDLCELVLLYGWRPTVAAIAHLVRDGDAAAWSRWMQLPAAAIAAEWQQFARQELLPRYVRYLVAASPKIARCLWLLRTTPCVGPKMSANVQKLLEETPRLAEAPDLAAAVTDLTEAAKVVGTEKAKAWPSEEAYQAIKSAFDGFRSDLPAKLQLFLETSENLAEAAEVGQRFLRVADEAARAYRQLKRRNGVVDFQDLLLMARDLLRDHQDIRERWQRRFRFLLIDELQDTDPVQMELVEHLTGAGLTGGKLFAVGDHAQSIYRFRGADVSLFQALRRRMPHEGRLGLTRNFRSQPAILDFANALFGPLPVGSQQSALTGTQYSVLSTQYSALPTGLEDYEPLEAFHEQLNPGPCVEFLWSPREEKENVTEARIREADWIARRIAAMVANREELVAQENATGRRLRPVRPGDVVLLFRAMSNVELYETALRKYGLNYYLVGGRAFFAQQEIYDLLNLLRALENPQDAVSLAGTLRSPFCCLSDEALFVIGRHPEGLWAGLHDQAFWSRLPAEQQPRAHRARASLNRWRSLKDRLPIARLLGKVFEDSGYDAATQFEFLGDRKLANLWKLQDLARSFDRSGLFGMAEFIQRLGDLVRTQPREEQAATQPENADVVRLMTIHQSKGLEFPVVFIPDLAVSSGPARNPVAHWDADMGCITRPPADDPPPFPDYSQRLWNAVEDIEEWREDLRILYVACTRAEDYLVLSAALPANFSPTTSWMLALAERFDLKTGRCLVEKGLVEKGSGPFCAQHPEGRSGKRVLTPFPPKVRVTDLLGPPPECPTATHFTPPPRHLEHETSGDEEVTRTHASQPLPRILTVAELEGLVAGRLPEEAAYHFDAEDGSDRSEWERPRQRIENVADSEAGLRDHLLRLVLEQWNFAEAAGWKPLLERALKEQIHPIPPALRAGLQRILARFAESETCRHLATARTCQREVEFLLPLSVEEGTPGSTSVPLVRGVLDCLWQDSAGSWHLLLYAMDNIPPADQEKDWKAHRLALAVSVLAVQQQLGVWPKTVSRFYLEDGSVISRAGSRLQSRQALASLSSLLVPTRK
jgi:ATP-dependent helicase/nuclease subunit A